MTKTKARLISAGIAILVLATALFVLLPSVLSTTAGGAAWSGLPADGIETGAGTESNPYQIKTAEELAFMASKVNEGDTSYASAYYRLTTDIVLNESLDGTPNEWTAIGTDDITPFTGKFSGDGHTISGIVINKSDENYQGLFGCSKGTIMNVGVLDSSISGGNSVGGVCGYNYGTIENCFSTGDVSGTGVDVGGVCGYNYSNSTIKNCYSTGAVSGSYSVGGVCGYNYNGTITNCYSTGAVSGTDEVGGVCGWNNGTIEYCYYDADFYTGNAIGSDSGSATNVTGKTTADLCGTLPAGFDSAVWTAGSYSADGKKATATLPQLKVFEDTSAPTTTLSLYNFGTNGSDDWDTYTEISTADELKALSNDSTKWSGNYVLTANITLTAPTEDGSNWNAIGNDTNPFTGKFDGEGHTISGIVINKSGEDYQGLFGYSAGTIMNVGVINSSISGGNSVGGVCGYNSGTITNCYSTGAVSGSSDVGGVCGRNITGGTIENCYSTGAVSATGYYVGGVCGDNYGTIENCYSTGTVSAAGDNVGGVCGYNDNGTIENCYSTGAVSGTRTVGGVCGYNDYNSTITNCYSTGAVSGEDVVGGVCGENAEGTIKYCYYDTDFYTGNAIGSVWGTVTNVTGKTTADLCGTLPAGFDSAVWTAGSYSADGKKATATLPQLKVFESTSAPKTTLSLYNFGTEDDPDWDTYTEISTAEELQNINLSGNYVLTGDITLTAPTTEGGSNWTAIGNDTNPFTGKFDGEGHTISGIVINKSGEDYQGLFGYSAGTIMNVGVINSSISGGNSVGGVCGYNNGGTIENCYSTGAVSGEDVVGGVCGWNVQGTITNCYNTGTVGGSWYVGGVCGYNSGTIKNCYSTGAVSGTGGYVGGVCGYNDNGTIENCYSTGAVSGTGGYVGGVCGENAEGTIKNCYSTGEVSGSSYVGGVCGINYYSTITNCYYDTDFYTGNAIGSDSGSATNVTGKTTADLCGSLDDLGFDSAVWTAGSYSADGKKATATLPQLKVFESTSAPKTTLSLYNFGTEDDPDWDTYTEISTAEELQSINNNLSGNYVLTADITLTAPATESDSNWTAIGTDDITPFTGKFDGEGHTISGIVINKSGEDYQGLFGYSAGTIMNVGVINSSISGGNSVGGVCGDNSGTITNCYSTGAVSGSSDVGGVCGRNITGGTIENCYSTGAVSATGYYVGGVCGDNYGTIENCYNTGTVSAAGDNVGGVCGYNDNGTIENCYSTGAVSGTRTVGGVCGYTNGTIKNCYSTGAVSGTRTVGGVCGYNDYNSTITNCYSTGAVSTASEVGGVCGQNVGTIKYCYYDTDFYTGNAIGSDSGSATNVTGISSADLCGSLDDLGFDSAVWTAGSYSADGKKATATLPQLKVFESTSAPKTTLSLYNFGTEEAPDWDTYIEISTADELQNINLSGNYVLTTDITLTAPATEGGSNWTAIGTSSTKFTGKFSGDGNTISGIVINKSDKDYQGLFGYSTGTIMNVGVIDSSISGGNSVGGVCGWNEDVGTITNCYSTGAVSATGYYVGGVCGINNGGTIENCYSTGAVSGTGEVGGVCGQNGGTIENCYSTGAVSGTGEVGGVCGQNGGTIENCYSTGTVSGSNDVGGVCGRNITGGTIENCYSTGTVSGSNDVGGVCGVNVYGTIKNCYSTGEVNGSGEYVGGVCGRNYNGTIENCYSTGAVSGSSEVGGVCGYNDNGTITNCYYDTDFYTGNAIGSVSGTATNVTGISTAALCGSLPAGFDSAVWTAGSLTIDQADGKKATATLPQLKVFENTSAPKPNVSLYNFGTNGSDDWDTYTEISTAEELQNINLSGNYVLTADITLTAPATESDSNWTAIGTSSTPFTGKFSGDGHTISGIVINKSGEDYQGLFGYSAGTIMNVGVINSSISGGNSVGGVCGYNYGTIENCFSTGDVSGTGVDVGGVCGKNNGTIKNCYSTGAVSGTGGYVGGVCGHNSSNGTIKNCYSTGAVSGTGGYVGGVCGGNYGTITNCYSTGEVSGSSYVGGVCGINYYSTITNCYYDTDFYIGNAIGSVWGTVTNVTGKTTAELCGSLPAGFDSAVWTAGSYSADGKKATATLPQLKVFENTSAPTPTLSLYNFGTEEAPDWKTYTEISTAEELKALSNDSTKWSGNYILTTDITLTAPETESESNWNAIGTEATPFNGKFDGKGHTISGIVINSTSDYQGLFGCSKGTIMNVGVLDSSISGGDSVGGVCGKNNGTITNCYNTGAVSGTDKVGGVCGINGFICEITNCYSTGTVSGTQYVGGVCGYNDQGRFENCYYNKDSYTGDGLGYFYNALPNDVLGMTTKQFASGEVAYLLNGDQSAMIWKQNIGEDESPAFTGGTVYRNQAYAGCIHQPGTMSYVYNNSVNGPIYAGDYAETVVAPTYTEQGYTLHVCPCGDSYKDNYTDRLLLPAVKNLAVAGKTDSSVTLRWAANTNADGYIIEKSNGSAWERIITVKNNSTTTYQVTGLDKSTEYRFRVTPYVMLESAVLRGNAAEITAKTAPTELNGLQAVAATSGTAIRLAWEKNSTATGYIIDKLVDGSWVNVVTIKNNSSVSYTVSGLDSSTAYRFRVTPYTTLGDSTIRGTGMSATAKTAPTALTGLAATGATNGTAIRLTWEKNSTASGYIIDKLVDGSWVNVVTIENNSSVSYTVSGLDSSTAYRFRVTPYTTLSGNIIKAAGVSVSGKTAPAAISGLKIGNATDSYITLSWDKNTTTSGYIIEKLVGNSWECVATVKSTNMTRYSITGLDASTSYRFRVTPFTTFCDSTIRGTGASVTGKTLNAKLG